MKRNMIPKQAREMPHTRLAEGEATGHFHAATGPDVKLYEYDGGIILSALSGTEVIHQEHKVILVPPGTYDRSIVQEFDHFNEEARAVVD